MNRVVIGLALAALFFLPLAQAASAGGRTPIAADNPVNDVAIAATADRFAAATQDPGSRLTQNPSVPVWHLWNLDGSLRQSGPADPTVCPNPAPPNTEACQTDAKFVAVSADGRRVGIASVSRAGNPSYLFMFDDTGVRQGAVSLGASSIARDLAVDTTGQNFAVGWSVPSSSGVGTTGKVGVYGFDGATRFVADTDAAPDDVDISPSGSLVAAAAGIHYRWEDSLGNSPYANANIQGAPKAVDTSRHADRWSVAGFDSGFFALFSHTHGQAQPSIPEYQKREAADTSPIQAAAMRDDATAFALGNAAGKVRLYSLDPATKLPDTVVTLLAEKSGLGSATALSFSSDGRYLAAITGTTVRLYYTGNGALDEMWSDTRAGLLPNALAIDARGEHLVAAVGSTVVVYDATHKITANFPTASQQPGSDATYSVVLRNDGNRADGLVLSATPPSGVTTAITPSQLTLQPGAAQAVDVKVTVPATWGPGTLNIPIKDTINGGVDGTPTSTLAVTVPTVHQFLLEAVGADSKGAGHGGPATFDVTARNAGNVAESATLTVAGLPSDWTAQVTPATISLQPGATADLSVALQPPASALDGTRVTGTLQGGAARPLALTATVGASFAVHLTAPVGLALQPGIAGQLNVTVRNDGNTLDSIVVKLAALPSGWLGGFAAGQSEQQVDDLEPGATRTVQVSLRAPDNYDSNVPVQVTLVASSLGDPSKTSAGHTLVSVSHPTSSSSSSSGKGGNGIPGIAPVVLLAALALAAMAARRRA